MKKLVVFLALLILFTGCEIKEVTIDKWYGVPNTLESNVKELHEKVFEENDYIPSKNVKDISNSILKKVGK